MSDVILKVQGKPFRCNCGCNVFHRTEISEDERVRNKIEEGEDILECNACGAVYAGLNGRPDTE